jgi:hypothetical protein
MKWMKALIDQATTARGESFATTLANGEYTYAVLSGKGEASGDDKSSGDDKGDWY